MTKSQYAQSTHLKSGLTREDSQLSRTDVTHIASQRRLSLAHDCLDTTIKLSLEEDRSENRPWQENYLVKHSSAFAGYFWDRDCRDQHNATKEQSSANQDLPLCGSISRAKTRTGILRHSAQRRAFNGTSTGGSFKRKTSLGYCSNLNSAQSLTNTPITNHLLKWHRSTRKQVLTQSYLKASCLLRHNYSTESSIFLSTWNYVLNEKLLDRNRYDYL